MIGPETSKRVFELPHGDFRTASVRADFGHQEHLIPPAGERLPHALFAEARVVVPGVVHERDAGIYGRVDESRGGSVGFLGADVPAAQRKQRYLESGGTKGSCRNECGGHGRAHTVSPTAGFPQDRSVRRGALIDMARPR